MRTRLLLLQQRDASRRRRASRAGGFARWPSKGVHADGCATAGIGGMERPVIAIDGPAGAGKSTIARGVARRLDLLYVDTGAMYRAVAVAALERGIGPADEERLAAVARAVELEPGEEAGETPRVFVHGHEVTDRLRGPAVDELVPRVAGLAAVRAALVGKQRELARRGGVVLDGRDIGSHVLPDAPFKFFLTADLDVRVERRYAQLRDEGHRVSREAVRADLAERDRQDTGRAVAPLRRAPDAVVVDTTATSCEEAIEIVVAACSAPCRPGLPR
jgi:cytidylate kinase